jgi:hypothetical protein
MSNWSKENWAEYGGRNMLSFKAYLHVMSHCHIFRANHTDLDKDRVQWGKPTRLKRQLC